ncbi:conserved hypothetical protein [Ricinus communis]|uniref:Uncharacterized protein n=1 Tax=Ricinus communis TaxID=3988 RepID=B9SIT0_RICCO|nr:conserved hypothetical protein [Ricinus communis]
MLFGFEALIVVPVKEKECFGRFLQGKHQYKIQANSNHSDHGYRKSNTGLNILNSPRSSHFQHHVPHSEAALTASSNLEII